MSAVGTEECPNRLSHQEFEKPGFQIEASQSSKARDEQGAIRQERDVLALSGVGPRAADLVRRSATSGTFSSRFVFLLQSRFPSSLDVILGSEGAGHE